MMRSEVQSRIAPPTASVPKDISDAKVSSPTAAKSGEEKVDFLQLLHNSNREARVKRQAMDSGDMSKASSYEDFLESLNKKTRADRAPSNELSKDDFLKLFMTQLQQQDPLNPKDGSEMAAQLAQFNGLEQMMNVGKTLERMEQADRKDRMLAMTGYIGKEVTTNRNQVRLFNGEISDTTFNLDQGISGARLQIHNNAGKMVAERPLGALVQGDHQLSWDGKDNAGQELGDGIYTLSIVAQDFQGKELDVPLTTKHRITGLNLTDSNYAFFSDIGGLSVDDIRAVGEVGFIDRSKSAAAPEGAAGAPGANGAAVPMGGAPGAGGAAAMAGAAGAQGDQPQIPPELVQQLAAQYGLSPDAVTVGDGPKGGNGAHPQMMQGQGGQGGPQMIPKQGGQGASQGQATPPGAGPAAAGMMNQQQASPMPGQPSTAQARGQGANGPQPQTSPNDGAVGAPAKSAKDQKTAPKSADRLKQAINASPADGQKSPSKL